jgi:putative two-component system response regulator
MDSPVAYLLVVGADTSYLVDIFKVLDSNGYNYVSCTDADEAIAKVREIRFDTIVVNIGTPAGFGMDILEPIRQSSPETPVIILGANVTVDVAVNALRNGVFDFIITPFSPEQLTRSLQRAVRNRRQRENEKRYLKEVEEKLKESISRTDQSLDIEIIHRFAAVAEFRDPTDLAHNVRIGQYCRILARALSLPGDAVEAISIGGPLHDIGKACMPDSILLKKGPLTKVEANLMKRHTSIGKQMLEDSDLPYIETAASIALNHHERWDGTGYPCGLKGDAIPIEGRISILCDQYDTLRSARPYKNPISHEAAVQIITKGDGRTMPQHFDPKILASFKELAPAFDTIFELNVPPRI